MLSYYFDTAHPILSTVMLSWTLVIGYFNLSSMDKTEDLRYSLVYVAIAFWYNVAFATVFSNITLDLNLVTVRHLLPGAALLTVLEVTVWITVGLIMIRFNKLSHYSAVILFETFAITVLAMMAVIVLTL
jgi:hypothetical protein